MSHGATETFCGRISSRASRLIPTRQGLARSVPLSGAVGRSQFGLLDLGAGYGDFSRFSAAREKSALDFNPELIGYWEDSVRPLIFSAEDGTRIMLELRRVLKPGGRLIIIQPNFRLEPRRYFDDYTHKTNTPTRPFTRMKAFAGCWARPALPSCAASRVLFRSQ
jgi:hypothetical protein